MKISLSRIPDINALETAYEELLPLADPLSIEKLALYSQWTRFDPRLGEILVTYLAEKYESINPFFLHRELKRQPWPASMGVLLAFSEKKIQKQIKCQRTQFSHWCKIVLDSVSKAPNEQFFIGLRQLAGEAMLEDTIYSNQYFSRWGYLSRENLNAKTQTPPLTKERRFELLKKLIRQKTRITTEDYWNALDRCISRRQAERDLSEFPMIRAKGKTRARYFSRA